MSDLITLCWFLWFLLLVLSKAALRSAPQAVQCEVWVSEGGSCVRREKAQKGRGEGGREDDGTGVEFTHPAGSAHYWHVCLGTMTHPSCLGNEGECG